MEMTPATTTTNSTTTANTTTIGGGCLIIVPPTKSPEAESETPPRIQPTKPISFSNGLLKRHTNHHNHHAPPAVAYKECLKNHAASLGGHALDGCGEFMPAPTATASDPTSLKCAACGCHRNFHRREPDELVSSVTTTHVIEYHPHHRHHPLPPPGAQTAQIAPAVTACRVRSPDSQSPPPISSSYYPGSAPHMLLALSTGGGNNDSNNNINNNSNNINHHMVNNSPIIPSRKRFRTKFSQEQKERMHEFADKVGWKMQKSNEDLVNGFCNEIGVERGVFKVWMHNNKNSFGKRSATSGINPAADTNKITNNNVLMEEDENGIGNEVGNSHSHSHSSSINNNHSHHHQHQQYNGKANESTAPTNGSSSSS